MAASDVLDLSKYQAAETDFAHLSIADLLAARELYHVQLMYHPNVVATAIGRYRIRKTDSWPHDERKRHGKFPRRLDNSEVRSYSWPCVTVFVDRWQPAESFADRPQDMLPKTLYTPDGKKVPVCVIEAPAETQDKAEVPSVRYPLNNIGPGFPIMADVQDREFLATVGCLVSDGHRVYAVTNRHVTGEAGEPVYAILDGKQTQVGVAAGKQLTKLPFREVYPLLPGRDTFVNLDIGLIDLHDVHQWTTQVRGYQGSIGPMADFSGVNLSLSLIGCWVRGVGAAGGEMRGEVCGLFYRYRRVGGVEYVADLYIGPRSAAAGESGTLPFETLPGDSGTLWLLEPRGPGARRGARRNGAGSDTGELLPLAIQWGRVIHGRPGPVRAQSVALATLLSRVCDLLQVDVVRDWNLGQPNTWGAMGHFAIAARSPRAISNSFPKLRALMRNNLEIISHADAALHKGDFTGMGTQDFVPLADVPDFYWKPRIAKQGHSRHWEGPNHFADMDQPRADGKTLLMLTSESDANIDPKVWDDFYSSVKDLEKDEPIAQEHRGLLPFRVWQIFDEMVKFAADGDSPRFVCAAGVLSHYIGDACQPLHISYLHDGDPLQMEDYTLTRGKNKGEVVQRKRGEGVHSAYENNMVHEHRDRVLDALLQAPTAGAAETVNSGFEAAKRTIKLMRTTFDALPPADIVAAFAAVGSGGKAAANALWTRFGGRTTRVMKEGTHVLALLWQSAWSLGEGERKARSTAALSRDRAMSIVADRDFLPSMSISMIGQVLRRPVAPIAATTKRLRRAANKRASRRH